MKQEPYNTAVPNMIYGTITTIGQQEKNMTHFNYMR